MREFSSYDYCAECKIVRGTAYLYSGGPVDLACSCRRTLAVSRGSVRACKDSQNLCTVLDLSIKGFELSFAVLTSAVHAAMAEAAIDLCSGSALPFAGGDMSTASLHGTFQ